MLCGCASFLSASIKMAERKKQKHSRKKVAMEGGHVSVRQKILLSAATVNWTDANKLSCVNKSLLISGKIHETYLCLMLLGGWGTGVGRPSLSICNSGKEESGKQPILPKSCIHTDLCSVRLFLWTLPENRDALQRLQHKFTKISGIPTNIHRNIEIQTTQPQLVQSFF